MNIQPGLYYALEASGPLLSVALCRYHSDRSCTTLYAATGTECNRHAEELSKLLAVGLRTIGATYDDMTGVLVGDGPGSFTGLRIGYSFAQGLCYPSHPLIVVPTYEALASVGMSSELVAVIGDARRGELFCGLFERQKERLLSQGPLEIRTPEDFTSFVEAQNKQTLSLVLRDEAQSTMLCRTLLDEVCSVTLSAPHNATALCTFLASGGEVALHTTVAEYASLTPRYLRKPAARTIEERTS